MLFLFQPASKGCSDGFLFLPAFIRLACLDGELVSGIGIPARVFLSSAAATLNDPRSSISRSYKPVAKIVQHHHQGAARDLVCQAMKLRKQHLLCATKVPDRFDLANVKIDVLIL